jgi:Kef-type K+ transport system membrane component KefB/mannitol/fructose-specific phosphotransferase system IIA component (Ntr-type)
MERLDHHAVVVMFLAIGVLLTVARTLGEIARRWGQPAVLGEILAGILLGPAIFGRLAPEATAFLFPQSGPNAIVLDGLTTLAIALFLLVAGLDVDLSRIMRQGRLAASVSVGGMVVPFAIGFGAAWLAWPYLGGLDGSHPLVFALFFATALSISALPVIAKTLMDLSLYRSDIGMVVVAAAIVDDLAGWIIFGVVLGLMGGASASGFGVWETVALTLGFAVFALTAGRWLINKALPWLQAYTSWPGGVMGFALALSFFGAAFTEWIGIHAIFGAYLVGIALGDSQHLRQQTRTTLHHFISVIFAPLFFASIGLKVDFLAHFDLWLSLAVLAIACVGKLAGCVAGARLSGVQWRESWAIGFGMNARGAMEIILGLLALQAGVIDERLFVALVVMALATSLMSGPAMKRVLGLSERSRFTRYVTSRAFFNRLGVRTQREAVDLLADAAARVTGVEADAVVRGVLAAERVMPTGIGRGLAIPHARVPGLAAPIVAVGISGRGIDFDAPDGEPAHLIFMVLTPETDDGARQLQILVDIAAVFRDEELRERALRVESYTEFVALLRYAEESFSDVSDHQWGTAA